MKGRTVCVILQNLDKTPMNEGSDNLRHFVNRVIWVKIYDEAPINEGSDNLCHFAKSWWSACKWLFRSIMCERFIQNAFESLQNLNFHFFIKWYSLEKQKVGVVSLAGKKCLFPDTQNMESKSDAWINFFIKVRFLGLWKMSFFWKFDENIQDLYYWENQHFLFSRKLY